MDSLESTTCMMNRFFIPSPRIPKLKSFLVHFNHKPTLGRGNELFKLATLNTDTANQFRINQICRKKEEPPDSLTPKVVGKRWWWISFGGKWSVTNWMSKCCYSCSWRFMSSVCVQFRPELLCLWRFMWQVNMFHQFEEPSSKEGTNDWIPLPESYHKYVKEQPLANMNTNKLSHRTRTDRWREFPTRTHHWFAGLSKYPPLDERGHSGKSPRLLL